MLDILQIFNKKIPQQFACRLFHPICGLAQALLEQIEFKTSC